MSPPKFRGYGLTGEDKDEKKVVSDSFLTCVRLIQLLTVCFSGFSGVCRGWGSAAVCDPDPLRPFAWA